MPPKAATQNTNDLLAQMMKLIQENFAGGVGTAEPVPETQWKGNLNNELKKNGIDEKPTYAAQASADGNGFVGTVTVSGQQFTAKEAQKSKKAAEIAAAKVAFEALYAEAFKKLTAPAKPAKGQKRKAESCENPKYKLHHGVSLMIANASARNATKEDVSYTVTAQEGSKPPLFMATVTIPEYEGGKSFSGEWCEGKQKAEHSAAQAALTAMADIFGALEEEQAAKKKAKNKKELEELKARVAAKNEAKKAAAA